MMNIKRTTLLKTGAFLLLVWGTTNGLRAQCAGNDETISVCDKDLDTANQSFDLFAELGGTPVAGGTWSTDNPLAASALNTTAGTVDLWGIRNSGTYEFTYTTPLPCSETATITLQLGGYPGQPNTDGSANACGDDASVNLFSFIGSNQAGLFPDFNGTWSTLDTGASANLSGNSFNAEATGPGIYTFTHTVPAIGSCPSRNIDLILEVHEAANAGEGSGISFCVTEDLSAFTMFDLNSLLSDPDGEPIGLGTWSEGPETNQLENGADSFVNIGEIRDNAGVGSYTFTYTVNPSHPICTPQTSTVTIEIDPVLQGTMEVQAANFCTAQNNFRINITSYDQTLLNPGDYLVDYEITSGATTENGVDETLTLLPDGTGFFNLEPSFLTTQGTYTLTLTSLGDEVCTDIAVPPISFTLADPMAIASSECEGDDSSVSLTDVLDSTGNPANGNFNVSYTLTGPGGGMNTIVLNDLLFSAGAADFTIPGDQIPETGTIDLIVEVDTGFTSSCEISTSLTVTPTPESIQLEVLVIESPCDADQVSVSVDAPILDNGLYEVSYEVVQQSDGAIVISNSISFNGGSTVFDLDVFSLQEGDYTVIVRSTQNDTTPCRVETEFEVMENFGIGVETPPATAPAVQEFCNDLITPDFPTLEDLEVTASGEIRFYANQTDVNALPPDTSLTDGEDYFVTSLNVNNNCESEQRVRIVVNFVEATSPTVDDGNATLCASENSTVSDLMAFITNGATVLWYADPLGGSPLEGNLPLVNGQSYYAEATSSGGCPSTDRTQLTVTLLDGPPPANASETMPMFCSEDNPIVANLEDSIDSGLPVVWYETPTGGTQLDTNTSLVAGTSYFAASLVGGTCSSNQRIEITPNIVVLESASLSLTELSICGLDNPTVTQLRELEVDNDFDILWYTTSEGGTPLEDNEPLTNSTTYYAESFDPGTGCTNSERTAVTVDLGNCDPEEFDFFVPDGFSPNGDGRNDTFTIPNIDLIFPNYTLEIFNRYGASLYKGNGNRPPWDGDNAPNGVYFYIIEFNKDGNPPKQGRLYLNR
ncbi:MAG: gliding motility-associated C-terminal domain-containing protein [Bacteroidota bacterium]